MSMEIRELDPFDDAAVDAWHAVYAASDRFERDDPLTWQLEECRVDLQTRGIRRRFTGYVGLVGGEVVSVAGLSIPLLDNLTQANTHVDTHPDFRGRGYGTAMLARMEALARENGRTSLLGETTYPYSFPADGSGHPYADFLTRRGFGFGLGDVRRSLELPVDGAILGRLAAEAAPHHTGYELRSWFGPVPGELVASYAATAATLNAEAPMGEIAREAENASVEAFRESEEIVAKQGRTVYSTVALDGEGQVAAYTDLAISVHDPGIAYQWGTLVRPGDRGHRLGIAVKVANLVLLQAERDDIDRLCTYNAEVNAPMVAVNEALGFRPVERMGEFHKALG